MSYAIPPGKPLHRCPNCQARVVEVPDGAGGTVTVTYRGGRFPLHGSLHQCRPGDDNRDMPRLSETLPGPRHPDMCQKCWLHDESGEELERWIECDERDRPEAVTVVLCKPCGKRVIDRHPRLYREMTEHQPVPGAMPICVDCAHRAGTICMHPNLKANGGRGLNLNYPKPFSVMWDGSAGPKGGRRTGGHILLYRGPVECEGRKVLEAPPCAFIM